jgi:branched-chain amino acid aminotransferase
VQARAEPVLPVDDSAFTEGRGCYTSALVRAGQVRHEAQHLARLARAAEALGLGRFDTDEARRAFAELSIAAFEAGEGIIRLQLSRGDGGRARLVGIPRPVGEDRPVWCAISASVVHPGALLAGGHKLTHRLPQALAGDEAMAAGCDEALLFDGEGRLVEGSRSNVVAVTAEGTLTTPPDARGGVTGIALGLLREGLPELHFGDLSHQDLAAATLILCVNAVRGARPVTTLDGKPVGAAAHPWLDRCRVVLDRDEAAAPG